MTLFPKIAFAMGGVILTVTLGLSASFYWLQERSLHHQIEQEQRRVLSHLAHIAQESFYSNDDLLLIKYASWLPKWDSSVISAGVTDTHGSVLAHSDPSRIGKLSSPDRGDRIFVLSEPVKAGTQVIATASVGFSQAVIETMFLTRRAALQKKVFWVSGFSLLGGLAVAFLIALSWKRPIRTLSDAARRVGQGKYQIDLNSLPLRHDELGDFSRSFQTMAGDLQQLDQMKEDFVSAVTHELRSPLGAIESYLNVIDQELSEGISADTWRTYIDRLRMNAQRLNRFVNDLLDVAALDRGKVVLHRKSTDMVALIRDVTAFYAPKMAERKLMFKTDLPSLAPSAFIDADKTRQVLTNLLSNAIKFTPPAGTIEVGLEIHEPKELRVSVRDSGVGIPLDQQQKIFNKFEQVSSTRPQIKGPKGTGLGLAIARSLVELQGGTLRVESALGEGSLFSFTVPLATHPAATQTLVSGKLV